VERLAAAIGGALAGLPERGTFLAFSFPAFLLGTAIVFALRRTRAMAFLRRELDRMLGGLLAALLLLMVFLSGLQILLRNLFDTGLLWIDPMLRHLVLLLALTGAVVATGVKRHVQINALGRLLRGKARRAAGTLVAAASAAICLALAHAALGLLREELEFSEIVFLDVPSWVVVGTFPVAFLVLAYRFSWLVFAEIVGEAPETPETEIDLPRPQEAP